MESSAGTLLFHPILIGVHTGEIMSVELGLLLSLLSVVLSLASVMWVSVSGLLLWWCLISMRGVAIRVRDAMLHGLVFQGSSSCAELAKTPSVLVGIGSFLALLEAIRVGIPALVSVLVLTVVLGKILVGGTSGMGIEVSSSMAEELRKSRAVVVRIRSFLALAVAGRMVMPVMVSDPVLAVVLGEIVVEEL